MSETKMFFIFLFGLALLLIIPICLQIVMGAP